MTTVSRAMYPVQTGMTAIGKMQERFATLQTQLATGQKATNLAEMGTDRYLDLSLRSRLGRIEGYQSNTDMVSMRLSVLSQTMSRLDTIESDARTAISPSAYGTGNINFGTAPAIARSRLDEVVSLLNTDVDGRYVYGGATSDKAPVANLDAMLNGAAGKAGFTQVAAERRAADVGDGLGRLTLGGATDTVTLADDAASPFGFKLSTLTASGGGIATTPPSSAAHTLSVQFSAVPEAGSSVSIGLTLPDGSEQAVTLKAVTGTPQAGEFQIGADATATASNFRSALQSSLSDMGKTELVSASAFAAADNFFNGQGQPILRAKGPDFANSTELVTADPATTVQWYKGGDSPDPRGSVASRIDEAASVSYGVQANESGSAQLVRSLAVLSIQSFSNSDSTATGRFDAIASRNMSRLAESHNNEAGSIEMVTVELGTAQSNVQNHSDRQTNYQAQLQGMLSDLETVPKEDVAMEMLALQTRLQASYQATSLIAQLSLVNYLG